MCVGASNQQRNEGLEYLLKYHVEWSEDPLVVLETIAGEGVTDLLGEDAAEESSLYPTLSGSVCVCCVCVVDMHLLCIYTP